MISFQVDVKPMGAVRMTQRSKWTSSSAQKYLAYKQYIATEARRHIREPEQGALVVLVNFYYPIPQRFNRADRERARKGEIRPTVKPDIDNCAKGIMDALNGIAWKDDNQVTGLMAHKFYADEPKIIIKIGEAEAA